MKKLYYLWILDRSGSMASVREQTVESINGQMTTIREEAKKNGIEAYVTLMLFDQYGQEECWYDFVYVNKPVDQIKEIKIDQYVPRGGTPLRDAIMHAVENIQKELGNAIADPDVKILTTIFTDGEENCSRRHSHKTVEKMIKHLSEDGKWTFTFMGAGGIKEVKDIAVSFGMSASNAFAYDNNAAGHLVASQALRCATTGYMTKYSAGADTTCDFFDQSEEK